jgi:hypothetical protein
MLEHHNHRRLIFGFLFSVLVAVVDVAAFSPVSKSSAPSGINSLSDLTTKRRRRRNNNVNRDGIRNAPTATTSSTTSLNSLLEVPPYFFTFTFPMLGILLTISKEFARRRLEESAWEQRLEEAREKRLRDNPSLTELDLRRKEAGLEWSAYGKPRRQEEEREKAMREEDDEGSYRSSSRRRVKVMEKDEDYDDDYDDDDVENRKNVMSDNEINQFEMEYGVEYDPYYDDPYSEEELPDEPFNLDRKYGDRRYKNGEIFYKDKESGLFYRQGAKPRNLSLWKQ